MGGMVLPERVILPHAEDREAEPFVVPPLASADLTEGRANSKALLVLLHRMMKLAASVSGCNG